MKENLLRFNIFSICYWAELRTEKNYKNKSYECVKWNETVLAYSTQKKNHFLLKYFWNLCVLTIRELKTEWIFFVRSKPLLCFIPCKTFVWLFLVNVFFLCENEKEIDAMKISNVSHFNDRLDAQYHFSSISYILPKMSLK